MKYFFSFPSFSHDLAEIIGIHFGDGQMNYEKNYTHRISYSCNLNDKQYYNYLIILFRNVFNIKLKTYKAETKSEMRLYFISKNLCKFLNERGIPVSPKNSLIVPDWIQRDKIFTSSFIRGLFDTDGCVVIPKKNTFPSYLKITNKDKNFLIQVQLLLLHLGIDTKIYMKGGKYLGYDLVIKRRVDCVNFFQIIKPRNQKHIKKWERRDLNPKRLVSSLKQIKLQQTI